MSDTAAVRQFIRDHFSEDDLTALAFDFFPNVANDFSAGMTQSHKVQLLLGYATAQDDRWRRLLVALSRMRPESYRQELAQVATSLDRQDRPGFAAVIPVSPVDTLPPAQYVPPNHIPAGIVQLEDGRYYHIKTGMEMVYVPAGPFLYGEDKLERSLPAYWIGRTPVTNAQYKLFLDANPDHRVPYDDGLGWASQYVWDIAGRTFPDERAHHPVYQVNWHDAATFCAWAGLDLPADEEWEKAARGTDGRAYPWGDAEPANDQANFNHWVGTTSPVGRYSAQGDSPFGCTDMSGNVWEWTASRYEYDEQTLILHGGSFLDDHWFLIAAARRLESPDRKGYEFGFRAAVHLPGSDV